MKWYKFMDSLDPEPLHYFMATGEDLDGINPATLKMGRRFESWDPSVRIWSEELRTDREPFDFLWNAFSIPTFSPRLQQALRDAQLGDNDIQFLPVRVFKSTGEEIHGYAFANVITRVAALDPPKCFLYEVDPEVIDSETGRPRVRVVGKYALRAKPPEGHHIVRLKEYFAPVFVSEQFANVINNGRFSGCILKPIVVS